LVGAGSSQVFRDNTLGATPRCTASTGIIFLHAMATMVRLLICRIQSVVAKFRTGCISAARVSQATINLVALSSAKIDGLFDVRSDSVFPTRKPTRLASPPRRRVFYSATQNRLGCALKLYKGGTLAHRFQNLEQAPSLAFIPLALKGSFAFKVYIVDQCERAQRLGGNAIKISPNFLSCCWLRGLKHFRQCSFQSARCESRLQGHCTGQERSQFPHPRAGLLGQKPASIRPRARFGILQPIRNLDPVGYKKPQERRKTLLERSLSSRWIPDKMPNAEGSKLFTDIPSG
jgi:hypothetical protein